MHHNASASIFKNAFRLRQNETEAERILWERLRKKQVLGLRFRRQHPISKFVLDFYCHKVKLAIEVDGGYHLKPEQQRADQLRTEELEAIGVKIIRFENTQVLQETDAVVADIEKELMLLMEHGR